MTTQTRRFSVTVPTLLVLLSLAILAPLIGFTLFSIDRFTQRLYGIEYQAIESRVASTSAAVDREVENLVNIGKALASSPSLANGNLPAFHSEALLARRSSTMQVILVTPDLQQVMNTRVAFGTALPRIGAPEATQKAFTLRKTVVSDIFIGKIAKRPIFTVSMPIIVDGNARYVLTVTDEPSLIATLLQQQQLARGWRAEVSDAKGTSFANNQAESGASLPPIVLPKDRTSGLLSNQDVGGEPSVVAFQTSAFTGWTTIVSVPRRVLSEPIGDIWDIMARAGLFAIASTILVAYFFSRPFANLIAQMKQTVSFIGKGAPLPPIHTILSEGRDIEARLLLADGDLRQSQQRNREARALLDKLLDTVPTGITIVDYPAFKVVAESSQARAWLGQPGENVLHDAPVKGAFTTVFLPDGVTPMTWDLSPTRRAAEENRTIAGERYVVAQPGGKRIQIEVSVSPFHNHEGEVIGTVGCWRDVTEEANFLSRLQESDEHLRLVLRELTHRAKNLLTVIMAIATQTARKNATLQDFLKAFADRVQGLGASHDLLVKSDWRGVQLHELLKAQLAPFGGVDGERIKVSGPRLLLKSDVLQALGLALHELATNATKYGALSTPDGIIDVQWLVTDAAEAPAFKMTWTESEGPPVHAPETKGFGHIIMVSSLSATLNGKVSLDFAETGLVWSVSAPLQSVAVDDE
jgi:two-component sensor histidine kinase